MTGTWSTEVRARLDDHLDAVEQALRGSGHSREHRRGVVDDLEAQIIEMVAARSMEPTPADLQSVLAGLDPPEAYGQAEATAARREPAPLPQQTRVKPSTTRPPRLSKLAVMGLLCLLGAVLAPLVGWVIVAIYAESPPTENFAATEPPTLAPATAPYELAAQRMAQRRQREAVDEAHRQYLDRRSRMEGLMFEGAGITTVALGILGSIFGWFAYASIRRSNGALYGKGLALFEGLCAPVLLGVIAIFTVPLVMIAAAAVVFACAAAGWFLMQRVPARE